MKEKKTFFFQFTKNWVGRVGKTKNKKNSDLIGRKLDSHGKIGMLLACRNC